MATISETILRAPEIPRRRRPRASHAVRGTPATERRTVTTPTDDALIAAILEATATLSTRERSRVTGISHTSFSRWRQGDRRALRGETRYKVMRYLEQHPQAGRNPLTDRERQRLRSLALEILRILDGRE